MKKTLITSVTAFAIILSAGMSMASPARDLGLRGHAHDVRSTVSQVQNPTGEIAKNNRTNKMSASIPASRFMCSFGEHNEALTSDQRCSFDLFPNIPGH